MASALRVVRHLCDLLLRTCLVFEARARDARLQHDAGPIVAALEAGVEPPSSAREARDVLRVIEAAYLSAATGERVELSSSMVAR